MSAFSGYYSAEPTMEQRRSARRTLGRPVNGTTSYIRADTCRMVTEATDRVDPILLLAWARRGARSPGWPAMNYGEIRAKALSPGGWLP